MSINNFNKYLANKYVNKKNTNKKLTNKKYTNKKYIKPAVLEIKIISIASVVLIYLLISLYFTNHFFFNTTINGVDVSLNSYKSAELKIQRFLETYKLQLVERNGETEEISGQEIGLSYNEQNGMAQIYSMQKSLGWISCLCRDQNYYIKDLYSYNSNRLQQKINQLHCLNQDIIEPRNADIKYSQGTFEVIKEVYGNKLLKNKLFDTIKLYIKKGAVYLDYEENSCYENPKYTADSQKTLEAKRMLNHYVSACITYKFGSKMEVLDGSIINNWLGVSNTMEAIISKTAVKNYVKILSIKYDTVGITRNFRASTGKIVEVQGGIYGWKIDQEEETKTLIENVKLGKIMEREPVYTQTAISREANDIGDTYVEINITRQHVWFYKDGKLITQGPVVTGNPNRGNSTVTGTYMLNYKQKDVTLKGAGYEANVTFWMPFYGNMGLHDAGWRYSFGGEIYKSRGSHGCVNAPLYLAKTVFEYIEAGIPFIIYEEK